MSFTKTQNKFSKGIDDKSDDTAVTIDEAGNVGIGTDAPYNGLTVETDGANLTDGIVLQSSNATNQGSGISWHFTNSTRVAARIQANRGSNSGSAHTGLVFSTADSFSSGGVTERMRIDASGNVGIGIDNPSHTLHVRGDGGFGLNNEANSCATSITNSADPSLANIEHYYPAGSSIAFRTSRTLDGQAFERMRIDANGKVGIGGEPQYPLDVSTSNLNAPIARFGYNNRTTWAGGELRIGQSNVSPYPFYLQGYNPVSDTPIRDIMLNPYGARVGIGGEPGTREAGEYLEQAKTQLAGWKAEVKKRTAEQPEASTQEITLEVTDGDFGVFPTAEALAEKLAERAIGGGNAKLQVAGDGYFGGTVTANSPSNTGAPTVAINPSMSLTGGNRLVAGEGGELGFGAYGETRFAGIKAFLTDASGKSSGELRFYTRTDANFNSDQMAEVLRLDRYGDAVFSGTVSDSSGPLMSTRGLISTLSTLRQATMDETQDIRESLRSAIDELVAGFEQQIATMPAPEPEAGTTDLVSE
jgi:hypothetical protein